MAKNLTYEKVLELVKETNRISSERLEKELEKGFGQSRKEFEADLKQSRKEFDKKIGELTGTLGKFVESMTAC